MFAYTTVAGSPSEERVKLLEGPGRHAVCVDDHSTPRGLIRSLARAVRSPFARCPP